MLSRRLDMITYKQVFNGGDHTVPSQSSMVFLVSCRGPVALVWRRCGNAVSMLCQLLIVRRRLDLIIYKQVFNGGDHPVPSQSAKLLRVSCYGPVAVVSRRCGNAVSMLCRLLYCAFAALWTICNDTVMALWWSCCSPADTKAAHWQRWRRCGGAMAAPLWYCRGALAVMELLRLNRVSTVLWLCFC